jgi:hypothetical protein
MRYGNGMMHISISPQYRLRLLDGRYVYMAWHNYCGPEFYHDKHENRLYEDWWKDPLICRALEWFQGRGCTA